MRFTLKAAILLAGLGVAAPGWTDPVKVGVMGPFSGPYSTYGLGWQQAIEVYLDQHGGKIGGHEVEFIYRDITGPDPQKVKALAQELVVREQVQYLAGMAFSPNAMALAPVSQQAQVPTIILNAGSTAILPASDYLVRSSFTTYQVVTPAAQYALDEGIGKVVTLVSDYAPGIEAEEAFVGTFGTGGQVLQSIRMPLSTTDFAPYIQTARALEPDAIFTFMPAGPSTFAFLSAAADLGLKDQGIQLIGTAETLESDLQSLGEAALGVKTSFIYSGVHDSDLNRQFIADLTRLFPGAVAALPQTEGYDGMTILARMIEATDGQRDAAAAMEAVKGFEFEGIRGPMKIDAETRGLIQNVYLRTVERDAESGLLVNREFKTYPMQPDQPAN